MSRNQEPAESGGQKIRSEKGARFKYEPALDGLRAVSILAVLGFHAGVPWLPGGFLGVDVFFVLSGFLITSLLVQEFDRNGRISLKNFYIRRGLRLLPALIALLIVFVLASALIGPWSVFRHNSLEALIVLLNGANWVRAFSIFPMDYLGHTWSLSIEEQFYLLWPASLLLLMRLVRQRKAQAMVLIALIGLSWSWRAILWMGGGSLERIYNGLDAHADGLMLGCLLALLRSAPFGFQAWGDRAVRYSALAIYACLAGLFIFFACANWQSGGMYLAGFGMVNVIVAGLILGLLRCPEAPIARLFASASFVWLGKLSYSLYLWHYPVYRAIQDCGFSHAVLMVAGPTISLLVASLSFYCLERPLLEFKRRFV